MASPRATCPRGRFTVGAQSQAAVLGTMGSAQSVRADIPIPMGTAPNPLWGRSIWLSTAPPNSPQSSPGSGRLPILGVPKAGDAGGVPRPAQPAVLGLLLAQAGGRQVQGRASSTRTLLRINLFTKGKPNPFPTMN